MHMVTIIFLLLGIMIFTMLERKWMSYMQNRKGPNKVGMMGVVTPVTDSVKLLLKGLMKPSMSKYFLYSVFPVGSILMMFMLFYIMPLMKPLKVFKYSYLVFLILTSFSVLFFLGVSFGSKSKYTILGGLRIGASVVTYEVGMMFMLFFFFVNSFSYSFQMGFQNMYPLFFAWVSLLIIWFSLSLMDLNRSPFDFAEGESELVSGVKVEYGGMGFAAFYLAEYGNMFWICLITAMSWF